MSLIIVQELHDIRASRDDLERKVHYRKLTRQFTIKFLPLIQLVQKNDKLLNRKIDSTLVNTIPLWETQLAQAVTVQRSAEAVKEASDLTNEFLTSNASNLREINNPVRDKIKRGVFDIEAIKKTNAHFIATVKESLQIANDGKRKRVTAEADLQKLETELQDTLASVKARATKSLDVVADEGDDL